MFTRCFVIVFLSWLFVYKTAAQSKKLKKDANIEVVFLQSNDIYEISPLDHGKIGGPARVATIRHELKQLNPLTYTILAGDFVSPSAIGTIKYDTAANKKIAGLQMIETLNAMGINLVTFGNHEFDISPAELQTDIDKSSFDWISTNVKLNDSTVTKRFYKIRNKKQEPIAERKIISFKDADGTQVKIGVFGLTITTPGANRFEAYGDYYASAQKAINELKGKCDFIVAVTHLSIDIDKELARRFPEIKLITGGHEHINSYNKIGNTIIAKADANVKSVYIHILDYNRQSKKLNIRSRLLAINDAIEEDANTQAVIHKWNALAGKLLTNQGFKPCEIVDSIADILDGTEANIRTTETNLGKLIGESIMEALKEHVDCSIYNSGSVRLDDVLTGYITQYDIFRVLPYENKIVVKELQGNIIDSLLKSNPARAEDGSYLQYAGIKKEDTSFYINGKLLYNDTIYYKVAMNNYLAMGLQPGLNFIGKLLPAANTSPQLTIPANDMRKALIQKFRKGSGNKQWPKAEDEIPCY